MNRSLLALLILIMSFPLLAEWLSASKKTILFSEKKLADVKKHYGSSASVRLTDWKQFVASNLEKSESDKLQLTNDFFNAQLRWVTDSELWQQKDYWATPLETLIKSAGDCECS